MIPPRAVLAAVDFSETSKQALVLAARLVRHCRADLHVLHVEDRLLKTAADRVGIDLARETQEELQRFIADARPAGMASPGSTLAPGRPSR